MNPARTAGRVALLATLALSATAFCGEPLLDQTDRRKLVETATDYFAKRRLKDEDLKAQAALPGLFKELSKRLDEAAKKKKVESLLVSAPDLRLVFAAPVEPVSTAKKGAFYDEKMSFGQDELKFFYRNPKNYAKETMSPVLLALHPSFKRADEVKKWAQTTFPDPVLESAIVLVPDASGQDLSWSSDRGHLHAVPPLGDMMRGYWIDRERMFLYGEGATAADAIHMATFFPSFFAGVIVRDFAGAPPTAKLVNLTHVPVLVLATQGAEGGGDAVTLANGFAEEAKKAGVDVQVVSGAADPRGGIGEEAAAAVAKFVTERKKNLAPSRIEFVTDARASANAYWLALDDFDAGPDQGTRVVAEARRDSNEIQVTTPATVRSFRIYLNDEIVDLGKTLKIIHVVEGKDEAKVLFEGTKSRNLQLALDLWFTTAHGNFGEAYTAFEVVSIPQT